MSFYHQLFVGFYCFIKKILPKEKNPEAYAIGLMSGAVSFLVFSVLLLVSQKSAGLWETAGIFLLVYALHHFLFIIDGKKEKLIEALPCSDQLVYRSLLFFILALSVMMYLSTVLF